MESSPAICALSYWRSVYLPTYVALRTLLSSSVVTHPESTWIASCLNHKAIVRSKGRYQNFRVFKSADAGGKVEYRQLIASSPTTAIMEAITLQLLASQAPFAVHPRVFSYLWPRAGAAPRIYAFYASGYRRRNEEITTLMRAEGLGLHAAIFDIKKFYPSIPRDKVRAKFQAKLAGTTLEVQAKDLIESTIERYLAETQEPIGIPLGSPLSHLLANVMLDTVDESMFKRFGNRYFRYVDDIVVVGDQADCAAAEYVLSSALDENGFSIHPSKTDTVSSIDWLQHSHSIEVAKWDDSFEGLLLRIIFYISRPLSNASELSDRLREQSFAFPLGRLAIKSRIDFFRQLWQGSAHLFSSWIKRSITETPQSLTEAAVRVSKKLCDELAPICERLSTSSKTIKRWNLQRARYVSNRLLYLPPSGSHSALGKQLRGVNDLYEAQAVAHALGTQDATHVLNVPGPAANTFCSIAQGLGIKSVECILDGVDLNGAAIDALTTVALHGLLRNFSDTVSHVELHNQAHRRLLEAASFRTRQPARRVPDFSMLDELECLTLPMAPDVDYILRSRFSDTELVELDGLLIGGGQSPY